MKPLVILRTIVRTSGILVGAFLVFTGLANLPRMFLGIAVILAGLGLGALVNVALRKAGQYIPPETVADPGQKNPALRFLIQPEILIVIFGFFFNFFWEVSQVPMYEGINRGIPYFGENTVEMKLFFVQTFWRAAFLDALLLVGAHLLTLAILRERFWFSKGGASIRLAIPACTALGRLCDLYLRMRSLPHLSGDQRLRPGPLGLLPLNADHVHQTRPYPNRRAARKPDSGIPAYAQGVPAGKAEKIGERYTMLSNTPVNPGRFITTNAQSTFGRSTSTYETQEYLFRIKNISGRSKNTVDARSK